MAPKRTRDDDAGAASQKKHKKGGFQVGPANLPDGVHKRKVQKIKKDLIHKVKLKKEYAKIKAREDVVSQKSVYERAAETEPEESTTPAEPVPEPTTEPHPDRLRLQQLEEEAPEPERAADRPNRRQKRPRPNAYQKETELARKRKEEAEARQKAREEAEQQRQQRLAERERFRKAMAKARGGPNGQRKLGRESAVLLEKVKRMVSNP